MIENESLINYNYATIKLTKSRIDKGLIAIPRSMSEWFPEYNTKINIYFDDTKNLQTKNYSSFKSSTNESRIGGMKSWFKKQQIKDGDELIVQIIDKERKIYKIVPENYFIEKTQKLQLNFDHSKEDSDADKLLRKISKWTSKDENKVVFNEYQRLIKTISIKKRKYIERKSQKAKENVPANIRVLLQKLYKGHCQICDFTFLKKDNTPYFEIHHLNASQGHHPKNLILVCANCHRQFEYANVDKKFNQEDWLSEVYFNETFYTVNQVILKRKVEMFKKHIYL
jgi:5-methylcytosine-specific restriction endonuclease McrA